MRNHFEGATPEKLAKALLKPRPRPKSPRKRKHLWPRTATVKAAESKR